MNQRDLIERGIDSDLVSALRFNPISGITVDDIDRVLAVYQGEREEEDWRWIVRLKGKGLVYYLRGGCDFTGWDCASELVAYLLTGTDVTELPDETETVIHVLYNQLVTDIKFQTWREAMDEREFDDVNYLERETITGRAIVQVRNAGDVPVNRTVYSLANRIEPIMDGVLYDTYELAVAACDERILELFASTPEYREAETVKDAERGIYERHYQVENWPEMHGYLFVKSHSFVFISE